MKIKNVKKFVKSIIMILAIIFGISLVIAKSTYSHGEKEYKNIYIDSGDTLWNIASNEAKNNPYYKNKDIRYIINDIIKENKLNSNVLLINQNLIIPVI